MLEKICRQVNRVRRRWKEFIRNKATMMRLALVNIAVLVYLAVSFANANPALVQDCIVATPSSSSVRGTNQVPGNARLPLFKLSLIPEPGTNDSQSDLGYKVHMSSHHMSQTFRDAYVSLQVVGDKDCGSGEFEFNPQDYSYQNQTRNDCPRLLSTGRKSAMKGLPPLVWRPPKCGCVQIRALVMDGHKTYGEDPTVQNGPLAQMACVQNKNRAIHLDTLCHALDRHVTASILSRGSFLKRHNIQIAWMDKYGLSMALELRRSDAKMCCNQASGIGREQCFDNIRRRRIDRFCADSYPDIPFSTFRDAHMRTLERKCCLILGPRRYECFSENSTSIPGSYPLDYSMDEMDPTNDLGLFGDEHIDMPALSRVQFGQDTVPQTIDTRDSESTNTFDERDNEEKKQTSPEQPNRSTVRSRVDEDDEQDLDDNDDDDINDDEEEEDDISDEEDIDDALEEEIGTETIQAKKTTREGRRLVTTPAKKTDFKQTRHDGKEQEAEIETEATKSTYTTEHERKSTDQSDKESVTNQKRREPSSERRIILRGSRERKREQSRRASAGRGSVRRWRSKEFQDDKERGSRRNQSEGRRSLLLRRQEGGSSLGFEKWYISRGCCKAGKTEGRHVVGHLTDIESQCEAGAAKNVEEIPMDWGLTVHQKCWDSFMACCQSRAVRGLEMTSSEFRKHYPEDRVHTSTTTTTTTTKSPRGTTSHQDDPEHDWDEMFDQRGEARYRSRRLDQEEEEEDDYSGPVKFDDVDNTLAEFDDDLMRGALERKTSVERTDSSIRKFRDDSDEFDDSEDDEEDEDEAFERHFDLRGDREGGEDLRSVRKPDMTKKEDGRSTLRDIHAPGSLNPHKSKLRHVQRLGESIDTDLHPRPAPRERGDAMETDGFQQGRAQSLPGPRHHNKRRRPGRRGRKSGSRNRSRSKSRRQTSEARRSGSSSRRALRRRARLQAERHHPAKSLDTQYSRIPMDSREMAAAFHHQQDQPFRHRAGLDSKEQREAFTRMGFRRTFGRRHSRKWR